MPSQSQAKPAAPQLTEANHYELSNGSLSITYTATDLLGRPHLSYQDGKQTRNYVGDQIQQEETALGRLLSVADVAVDFITHRFTLVLPKVLVTPGKAEKLSTFVVFENGGQVGRPPQPGPVETYSVKSLSGKANLIVN
ncbi:MAG TPA: hypothetical protein VF173_33775 [Thermoanaerobaculia bacterium]|nr:hypothetical protein [Thermoanaerobaculia bacterium]